MCSLIQISCALRVLQSIGHGLLRDAQQVLLHLLRQLRCAPGHIHLDIHARHPPSTMRVPEAAPPPGPGPRAPKPADPSPSAAPRSGCGGPCCAPDPDICAPSNCLGHAHGHRIELRRDADEPLGQGVVNLPGQARALFQHQGEALANLPQPQPVAAHAIGCPPAAPANAGTTPSRKTAAASKSVRRLAGRPAGNLGAHPKSVVAVMQAVVVDGAAGRRRGPSPDPGRPAGRSSAPAPERQVNGGIAKLDAPACRPQAGRYAPGPRVVVHRRFRDLHRRRQRLGLPARPGRTPPARGWW